MKTTWQSLNNSVTFEARSCLGWMWREDWREARASVRATLRARLFNSRLFIRRNTYDSISCDSYMLLGFCKDLKQIRKFEAKSHFKIKQNRTTKAKSNTDFKQHRTHPTSKIEHVQATSKHPSDILKSQETNHRLPPH